MKLINWILGKKRFLLMALFVVAVLAVFLLGQKSCGGGYDSPEYLELKGQFTAYKTQAEQKEKEGAAMEEIITKSNEALRNQVDKLEIEKGLALVDTADANKEIFEKDLELTTLREKEAEIEELPELVLNLRAQILTLENKVTLKDTAAIGLTSAFAAANKQILKLEGIIFNKDLLIDGPKGLRVQLAAERVARMACEDLIKVGEKNTLWFKIGKLAGNGFKIYGIYSAGRDILKGAKI